MLFPLSYGGKTHIHAWSRRRESNSLHPAYEAGAHPNEHRRQTRAASRSRPGDLTRTRGALFQLSYDGTNTAGAVAGTRTQRADLRRIRCIPLPTACLRLAFVEGLEPPTPWFVATRSGPTELHEQILDSTPRAPPAGFDPAAS